MLLRFYLINPLLLNKGLISGSCPVKSLKAWFRSTEFPTERIYFLKRSPFSLVSPPLFSIHSHASLSRVSDHK
jgi:hypothetical protein